MPIDNRDPGPKSVRTALAEPEQNAANSPHASKPGLDQSGAEPAIELDLRGLRCPLPVLKIQKRMREMAPREILRAKVTDEAAVIDVPHYCHESGNLLQNYHRDNDGVLIFDIQKN